MRVIRVILTVIGLGLAAGGVSFVIEAPPGTDGVVKYLPAGMMFFFSALMFKVWLPMISRLDHGSIHRSGTPATATIVAIADTGTTVNERPVFRFTLDVHHADGTTRRATTDQIVSRAALGSLQTGLVVPVKVDGDDPDRVAIDPAGSTIPVAYLPRGPANTTAVDRGRLGAEASES